MPYTGSGANKVPLGKINPILLGQKKDTGGSGPPSLLSQHLNRRRDGDSQGYTGSQSDGPWNSPQGSYNKQDSYNQQRNYNQQSNYNKQGNYNQKSYNSSSQNYGNQSSNYGDSRQQSSSYDNRQMNHPGSQPPRPLMSLVSPQGPGPYNQGQGFNPGGMNYQNSPQNYGMPPMPSTGAPPQNFNPQNQPFPGQQGGYNAPPPPLPATNSAFNPPPPPPNYGGPPLPPGGSNPGMDAPPPPLPPSKFSDEPPPAPVSEPRRGRSRSPQRKKKRRSRWGDEEERTNIPGMPANLPSNVTQEQKEQYLLHFKIEEISIKLRSGDLGIPANPEDRSPSPEPIYNTEGKRLNTREFRVRKNLEEERHALIQKAVETNPDYKPPIDYRPPSNRIQEKVMIPQDANPAINFIGLLIGPRGNTLKKMEKETNCKIIIRGKGSVKEGKGRPGFPLPGENEPLHALVTGPTTDDVKKAVKVIEDIIKEGVETPEGSNELRKMQLRELAALNGTLIEEDIARCRNCGATDHRHWECTEVKNVTSQVLCTKCNGYGHVAKDCVFSSDSDTTTPQPSVVEKAKMDDEYMSLMAELGVDNPASSTGKPAPAKQEPSSQTDATSISSSIKTSSSAPPPWSSDPKPLLSTPSSTSYSQKGATPSMMPPYSSSGLSTSSSQWHSKPPTASQDQRSNENYQNTQLHGVAPPWSQQGSQASVPPLSNMGQPGNMNTPPMNGSSTSNSGAPRTGAPLPWQPAPLPPWQQAPAAPYVPPAGFAMPPPGIMYPQMGQAAPPIPPWTAPPPPPPPPSK